MAASQLSWFNHRAVWRWHCYALALAAPCLLILAVTGAVALFGDRLNDSLYPELRFVPPHTGSVLLSQMAGQAVAAHPGLITGIDVPAAINRAAVVFITPASGPPLRVAVDPGTARVMGAVVYERTPVGFAESLHTALSLGPFGAGLLELAACWTLVLIVTGFYLWWPKGSVDQRKSAPSRPAHRLLILSAAGLTAFCLVTGLSGTTIEGRAVKAALSAIGLGYPANTRTSGLAVGVPTKICDDPPKQTSSPAPGAGSMDHSSDVAQLGADPTALDGLDAVAEVLNRRGLSGGYHLVMPAGPTGVYTAYTDPARPEGQRTLHFDRYSGGLIREVGFSDYGAGAKAIEIGAQLHRGVYLGGLNRIAMLAACLGVVVAILAGLALVWKHRPALRVEPRREGVGAASPGAIVVLVVASLLAPMVGASLIVFFIVELVVEEFTLPSPPPAAIGSGR